MGSKWQRQGPYNPRQAKVIKFPSAYNTKTGKEIFFTDLKKEFFVAANSEHPEAALKTLREKFNLVCPQCKKAGLVFSFGSQNPDGTINSISGVDISGNPAHLKTKPGHIHERTCKGIVVPHESHEIDDTKGYRIHLNLSTIPERDPRSQRLVERLPGGKIIILDEDLKDREPLSVTKIKDLITPMRSGKIEKLQYAVVVRGNRKIPWSQFMIPATAVSGHENPSMEKFAKSFYKNAEHGHPVLINLDFKNCIMSPHHDRQGKSVSYYFPKIAPIFIPGQGKVKLRPELLIENEHLFEKFDAIHRAFGEIFVLAEHVFIEKEHNKGDAYSLKILLRNPTMVMEGKLEDIMATAQKRHDKIQPQQDLLSQPHP